MGKKNWIAVLAVAMSFLVAGAARASTHEFYRGKLVRIIVGASPGGGFDTYARTIARHMGKHIPGNPDIIVINMPGAGQRIAANHLYKVAKPDGLTIGTFFGGLLVGQILGHPGIQFDAVKFEYLGVPIEDHPVCVLTKASGVTSMDLWKTSKKPVKLGATGADDIMLYGIPKILNATIGLPIQVVAGYRGTSGIRLAAESGELAGGCWGWESIRSTWQRAVETGDVVAVLQALPRPHSDLPNVPLAIDFAKTEEARQLIQTGIHNVNAISRPYVLPPGTPKARVQLLRKAFMDTLGDPELLAEASKAKLIVDPVGGEKVAETIAALFNQDPATWARLKEALK